ncbi:MAG: hypothetical protein Tsb0032_19900 [Kiloniellaceae bacterium]
MTMQIFDRAAVRLQKASGSAAVPGGEGPLDEEAEGLLLQLGYLVPVGARRGLADSAKDAQQKENRLALLRLAAQLERLFQLPSPHVPRAVFLGSEVAPASFGLASPDGRLASASGRGLTPGAAFESCIGEAAEYLSFLPWGDEALFSAPLPDVYPDHTEDIAWLLGALHTDEKRLGAAALDWIRLAAFDGARELVTPFDLCLRREAPPGAAAGARAESSGCAAGPTLEDAQYVALMELIERDAVALWWYGGLPAGPVQLDGADGEALNAHIQALRAESERPCWLLDITNDTAIPAAAALSSTVEGRKVVCGFAADMDPVVAAEKALLELCQMELAEEIVKLRIREAGPDNLKDADHAVLQRLERLDRHRFPQLSPRRPPAPPPVRESATTDCKLSAALQKLRHAGLSAYWLELSRKEIGIPVVRVIAPELQSIDVSWRTNRLSIAASNHNYLEEGFQSLPPII